MGSVSSQKGRECVGNSRASIGVNNASRIVHSGLGGARDRSRFELKSKPREPEAFTTRFGSVQIYTSRGWAQGDDLATFGDFL